MIKNNISINPCLTCGACCSYYRISFYEGEIISGHASEDLISELEFPYVCMAGTESGGRCNCLTGEIGKEVKCSIYNHRPSVCKGFNIWNSAGIINKRCNNARGKHGLIKLFNK